MLLQPHIGHLQLQDGLFAGEEQQDPHGGNHLAQNSGHGCAGHAHIQGKNEDGIQHNVDHRADNSGQHGDGGEALGGDEGIHTHDDQHGHGTQDINSAIGHGIGQCCLRGAEEAQQGRTGEIEHNGQHHSEAKQHRKAVCHDLFGPLFFALTHGDSCPGSAAGTGHHGESCDQHQNGREQAHTGEGRTAFFRDVTDVNTVNDVVQQVYYLSHQGGNSHLDHQLFHGAGAHILLVAFRFCHSYLSLLIMDYSSVSLHFSLLILSRTFCTIFLQISNSSRETP